MKPILAIVSAMIITACGPALPSDNANSPISAPVHVSETSPFDKLSPSAVAAASDAVVVASCNCDKPIGFLHSNPKFDVHVDRVLYSRPGVIVAPDVTIIGRYPVLIPRGDSILSLSRGLESDGNDDFELTHRITSVGFPLRHSIDYRLLNAKKISYDLAKSWIGCFWNRPKSELCTARLLSSHGIMSRKQRSVYYSMRFQGVAASLEWMSLASSKPGIMFPERLCRAESDIDCASLDRFRSLSGFKLRQ